jgi:photosystem II stability/assembly factor-like uncharacterized protein
MNRSRLRLDLIFRPGAAALAGLLIAVHLFANPLPAQASWSAVGPAGGDARALAAVPGDSNRIYMGTTDSWIYESADRGASWRRLAKLGESDDLIVDHIVVDPGDPATIYAAAWKLDPAGGGLWVSRDGGKSWTESAGLRDQSIRAFTQAPSDPRTLFAGTLEGVFRSADGGASWAQISPPGSSEIHEIESLAVDPADPNIVYAGTWHLPWKTTDGGKNWESIKTGIIEDSDVFSIVLDAARPSIVYLSACSGIYKSENAGERFRRIQGIPSSARRTRVLMQDPRHPATVYAGTTEGLYKTLDGGKSFKAMTGPDVIVNDVFVDPTNTDRVLLATDRGGALASTDGGSSFAPSNQGFSGRKVEALLVDRGDSDRLYAGAVNDKSYGGVFVSADGGARWEQLSDGLDGRDVFSLAQAADGTVLAGTGHGIFALEAGTEKPPILHWQPRNVIVNTPIKAATETHYGKRVNVEKQVRDAARELDSRVNALDLTGKDLAGKDLAGKTESGEVWLAATTGGLFTSRDRGASWQGGPVMGASDYLSVTSRGGTMAAARPDGAVLSFDAGLTWTPMGIPEMLTRIHRVAFSADGTLWLGAREGVYFTHDLGKTWLWIERLPLRDVDDLYWDARRDRVLVSSRSSEQIFSIDPKTLDWQWSRTGFRIALIRAAAERLVAASLLDGVVIESPAAKAESGRQ